MINNDYLIQMIESSVKMINCFLLIFIIEIHLDKSTNNVSMNKCEGKFISPIETDWTFNIAEIKSQ